MTTTVRANDADIAPASRQLPVRISISLTVDVAAYIAEYGPASDADIREHITSATLSCLTTSGGAVANAENIITNAFLRPR